MKSINLEFPTLEKYMIFASYTLIRKDSKSCHPIDLKNDKVKMKTRTQRYLNFVIKLIRRADRSAGIEYLQLFLIYLQVV